MVRPRRGPTKEDAACRTGRTKLRRAIPPPLSAPAGARPRRARRTATTPPPRRQPRRPGPVPRSRSARRGTASGRTSHSSPRSPTASSSPLRRREPRDPHRDPRGARVRPPRLRARRRPGQRYGFRVHGQWAPANGKRSNRSKLLLDPYGKAVTGAVQWGQPVYPYRFGDENRASTSDSARFMPKTVVINPYFDWGNDRPPNIPWNETIVYEVHVKGFTQRHPAVPPNLRGTYAGLAVPEVVDWLVGPRRHRGRTDARAPVRARPLPRAEGPAQLLGLQLDRFLAPHGDYAAGDTQGQQVQEFKQMVKTLHTAGHRGDPRRRLQPHRRRQPARPDAVVQGHRQRGVLPAVGAGQARVRRLHGHRQHAEHAAPARAAAHHGQPAVLGARDARRRLPLRPRVDAGAHAARGRPAVGVLRRDPAGPGASAR